MTLRVALVDDNERFLDAAAALLRADGVEVVAVASSSSDALEVIDQHHLDAVLVDISLGDESGFELAAMVTRRVDGPPIVLISGYEYADFVDLVRGSGAAGFLPKATLSGAALRAVLDGSTAEPASP